MKLHSWGMTCVDNEKLYIVSTDLNALFCVDMKEWIAEYVMSFEEYPKERTSLFNRGILIEDTIYFIPLMASHVVAYHLTDKVTEYIKIGEKPTSAVGSCFEGKILWLFMMSYPNRVIKLNLDSRRIEERYLDWDNVFRVTGIREKDLGEKVRKYTILSVQKHGDKCWIVLFNIPGILLSYDVRENRTEVHKIKGLENEVFSAVVIQDDCIWINITNKKKLAKWEGNINELEIIDYEATDTDEVWSVMAHIGKYIITARGRELVSLDITDNTVKTMYYSKKSDFRSCERIGNEMFFFPYEGDAIIIFDSVKNEIREQRVQWKQQFDSQLIQRWFGGYILRESVCGLNEFIDAVPSQTDQEKERSAQKKIGSVVWEKIR